jgi:hypothetical protein
MGICFNETSQIVDIYSRDKSRDKQSFCKPHVYTNVVQIFWFDLLFRHMLINIIVCLCLKRKDNSQLLEFFFAKYI